MYMAALPALMPKVQFGYFDAIFLVWLIIGLFVGRKRGMSQELLPMLQWLAIIVAGGALYWPFSFLLREYVPVFDTLWSCITAYLVIAGGVHLIYAWFKQMFAAKLVELDLFGRGEFYLGMMAGVVRFACMMIFAMSLLNAHIVSEADRAQNAKMQADSFSGMHFKTPAEMQQDVLFGSWVGKLVESNLTTVIIATVKPGPPPKRPSVLPKHPKTNDDIPSKSIKQ